MAAVAAIALLLGAGGLAAARFVAPPLDTRPSGSSDAEVLKAVGQWFHDCATDSLGSLSTLVTCPQQGDRHDEITEQWSLEGDPTLGASVLYVGRGRFRVSGRFVMVMAGRNPTYFPQVDASPYQAAVVTNGARLEVARIDRMLQGPPVPRPPDATDAQALRSATVNWQNCSGQGLGALFVRTCPPGLIQPCGSIFTQRRFVTDQGGTPRLTWSPEGLLHVVGTYTVDETITSSTPGCPPTRTTHGYGAYDLLMAWNFGSFNVIEGMYPASA